MPRFSRDELVDKLRDQMGFLQRSADTFDAGIPSEALRLAVTLRVLLYDKPDAPSLLAQLGFKQSLRLVSTGAMPPARGGTFMGAVLAPLRMGPPGTKTEHVAMREQVARAAEQPFYIWWKAPIIGTSGYVFTREDVVLALAHKEGGAHVSAKIATKYDHLRRLGIGGVCRDASGLIVDPGNPALPSCRQISFEVEVTIHEQLSSLLH